MAQAPSRPSLAVGPLSKWPRESLGLDAIEETGLLLPSPALAMLKAAVGGLSAPPPHHPQHSQLVGEGAPELAQLVEPSLRVKSLPAFMTACF